MLTTGQVDHFRTFGFTMLRGYLADRIGMLRAEAGAAIRDAYAASYDERVIDGISGHYLPMASRLTPVSTSLVCDDPRLIDAAEQLLGGPVLPECPEGVLYFFEAGWHTDDGIGVPGVKFAAYFDDLTGDTGALRLVPGSHHPEQNARLGGSSRRRGPARGEAESPERHQNTTHQPEKVQYATRGFAFGLRGGIFATSIPALASTASNASVNCPARSRIRNRNWLARSPRSISRFRACCTVHAPSGCAVTPRMWTWRVPTSSTKNTYRRRRVTAQSTWKKSQASIVAAWLRRNCRQVARSRCGAGGIRSCLSTRRTVEAPTR